MAVWLRIVLGINSTSLSRIDLLPLDLPNDEKRREMNVCRLNQTAKIPTS